HDRREGGRDQRQLEVVDEGVVEADRGGSVGGGADRPVDPEVDVDDVAGEGRDREDGDRRRTGAVGDRDGRSGVAEGYGRAGRAGHEGEGEDLRARAAGVGDGQGEVDLAAAGDGSADEEGVRRHVVAGGGGRQVGVRGVAGHDRHANGRGGQGGVDGRGSDRAHVGERDRQVPGLVGLDEGVAVADRLGRDRRAVVEEGLRRGTTSRQERLRHDDAGAGVLVDSGRLDVDRRAGQGGAERSRRDRRNRRLAQRRDRGGMRRGGRGPIEGIEARRGTGDTVGGRDVRLLADDSAGAGAVARRDLDAGGAQDYPPGAVGGEALALVRGGEQARERTVRRHAVERGGGRRR